MKAIGISNFSITKTDRLLQTAKIVPAVNQVECHPYLQQPKLKEYLDSKGECSVSANHHVCKIYSHGGSIWSTSSTQSRLPITESEVWRKLTSFWAACQLLAGADMACTIINPSFFCLLWVGNQLGLITSLPTHFVQICLVIHSILVTILLLGMLYVGCAADITWYECI